MEKLSMAQQGSAAAIAGPTGLLTRACSGVPGAHL